MKVTVEIPDDELRDAVKLALVKNAVDQLEADLYEKDYSYHRRVYSDEIKKAVRALLKEHMDDLSDRAVSAAATSIHNKGVKKLLDSLEEAAKE